MNTLTITPALQSVEITATQEYKDRRDALLGAAVSIQTVADRLDADCAVACLRNLTKFQKGIEDARSEAKAPVLDLGRRIDAIAKELAAAVTAEANRISRLVGAFEAEERKKAEAARRQAEAEIARIAEEARKKADAAINTARNAEDLARKEDAIKADVAEQIAAIKFAPPVKTDGAQLREVICFEVLDIQALFAAEPSLVTLEPNGTAIRAILKANPNLKLPGVKHWRENKLNVR
jgi:hypothetical protein